MNHKKYSVEIELFKPIECGKEEYTRPKTLSNSEGKETRKWSGFIPPLTQGKAAFRYPIQKENIKQDTIYAGIEHSGNKWMELACSSAFKSVDEGGGPFGAVLLQIDNETSQILRYWSASNQVTMANDPTAHAEIMAIRSASAALGVFNLGEINKSESKLSQHGEISHCEIYSSCEPCPMCYSAILWARISHLYFASTRFDAAVSGVGFSDEEIYKELEQPYKNRKIQVAQCSTSNSLDAFNLWKNTDKVEY